MVLINPPYGESTDLRKEIDNIKQFNQSKMIPRMKNYGGCQKELFAQFITRIYLSLKQHNISHILGLLCKNKYLNSQTFLKFRSEELFNLHSKGLVFLC